MDVVLKKCRNLILVLAITPLLCFCGSNHYDPNTESGRRALIDDANTYLSSGQCQLAYNSISQLYGTTNQTEEVQLIMSSTYACFGGFNMLTVASNLIGANNYFTSLAKSEKSTVGDSHIASLYSAADVLTNSTTTLSAVNRSASVNNYLVFIEAGIVGAILSTYGKGDASGKKTQAISYSVPRGVNDLSTVDACALAASLAIIEDSFNYSSLSDSSTASLVSSLNTACVSAGLASCTAINKDRTKCTGLPADLPSSVASGVVGAINADW